MLFFFCPVCHVITCWACIEEGDSVEGECEECGTHHTFEEWDEVMYQSHSS